METNSGINFKREQLGQYRTITSPGTYELQVANNVSEKNLFRDADGKGRYIINLKAIASDKLAQVKETFKEAEVLPIEATAGLFMTGSIWKNGEETPVLPMKGETVKVTVGFVASREGEEVLRVTNIVVQAAKQAAKLNLQEFFAPVEAGVIAH